MNAPSLGNLAKPTQAIHARVVAGLVLSIWFLSIPFVLYGAKQAWDANSNRVDDWIPIGHPETREQDRFVSLFGSDELLAVTWDGCQLEDPRLVKLGRLFSAPLEDLEQTDVPMAEELRNYFRKILTGPEVLQALQDGGVGMSSKGARARMVGWILGQDGIQTGAIALASKAGMNDRRAAVVALRRASEFSTGLESNQILIAGPTIESVAIDAASRDGLLELNLLSFAVAGAVILFAIRNLRASFLLLAIALYNEQLALAVVHFSGGKTDAVLLLMANVTFVLSISGGCHLMRYFRTSLLQAGPLSASMVTLQTAYRPIALATLTSVIGFGSLAASNIIPIQNFGIYSAVMILVSGILMPTIVLCSYTVLRAYGWHRQLLEQQQSVSNGQHPEWFLSRPLVTLARRWWLIVPLFSLALFGFGLGLPKLTASLGMTKMFPEDAKVIQDYRWIEQNLAPLVPIEVVISVPDTDNPKWLDELSLVAKAVDAMRDVDSIETVVSPLNFMPSPPLSGSGIRFMMTKRVWESKFPELVNELEATGSVRLDEKFHHWRISGRMRASEPQNYARIQADCQTAIAEVVDASTELLDNETQPVTFQISGGALIFERMQKMLLRDMGISLVMAVALIGIVMAISLQNVVAGLVSLLPNIIPPVTVFGAMGWLNMPLEIGSVLTAAAAIGVAVDDTLHLIYAFAEKGNLGNNASQRIRQALTHCGPAMVQTSAICCLGMIVFAASDFVPIVRFAFVIAILLAIALICDLVLLPALLCSPIGRRFLISKQRETDDEVQIS